MDALKRAECGGAKFYSIPNASRGFVPKSTGQKAVSVIILLTLHNKIGGGGFFAIKIQKRVLMFEALIVILRS